MTKENKELSPQEKAKKFVKEYEKLCKEYGLTITVTPNFKARDDGTWSIVLQTSLGKTQNG